MNSIRTPLSSALASPRLSLILAAGLAFAPVAGLTYPPSASIDEGFAVVDHAEDPQRQFGLRLEAALAEQPDACSSPVVHGISAGYQLFLWQAYAARLPCADSFPTGVRK